MLFLKQYECLVEGCGVKLKSYKSRQQHLLDKHQFPKSFEFFKKARPSQRQRNKNQKQRQTVHKGDETSETLMDVDGKKSSRYMNSRYRPKQHDGKESKENEHSSCKEAKNNEMEVDKQVDELASAVSRLSTADSTPSSISFGHRRSRGLAFVPRSIRQNKQVSQTQPKWQHLIPSFSSLLISDASTILNVLFPVPGYSPNPLIYILVVVSRDMSSSWLSLLMDVLSFLLLPCSRTIFLKRQIWSAKYKTVLVVDRFTSLFFLSCRWKLMTLNEGSC